MIGERAHMLLPLTSDKETIHGALAEIRNVIAGRAIRDALSPREPHRAAHQRYRRRRTDRTRVGRAAGLNGLIEQSNRFQSAADAGTTYLAVREVARSFANAPGRKIILLFTGGFTEDKSALISADPRSPRATAPASPTSGSSSCARRMRRTSAYPSSTSKVSRRAMRRGHRTPRLRRRPFRFDPTGDEQQRQFRRIALLARPSDRRPVVQRQLRRWIAARFRRHLIEFLFAGVPARSRR